MDGRGAGSQAPRHRNGPAGSLGLGVRAPGNAVSINRVSDSLPMLSQRALMSITILILGPMLIGLALGWLFGKPCQVVAELAASSGDAVGALEERG